MNVFISSSAASRQWAGKLKEVLSERLKEVSPESDVRTLEGAEASKLNGQLRQEVEQAMKAADAIVVLVDKQREPDELQSLTWEAALEASWDDPHKDLIPLLLPNAEAPSFLRGVEAIRVKNLRHDWERAADEVLQVLKGERDLRGCGPSIDESSRIEQQERLLYLQRAAESLKSNWS